MLCLRTYAQVVNGAAGIAAVFRGPEAVAVSLTILEHHPPQRLGLAAQLSQFGKRHALRTKCKLDPLAKRRVCGGIIQAP